MQTATVLAATHATVKHDSFVGQRLVVIQPLGVDDQNDGPPLVALDCVGCRTQDRVMITSDGSFARDATQHKNTPARWTIIGIIDEA